MKHASIRWALVLTGGILVVILLMQRWGTMASVEGEALAPSPTPLPSTSPTPTPWHEHIDLTIIPADRRDEARQQLATLEALTGPWPTPIIVPDNRARPAGAGTIYEKPGYVVPNLMKNYLFYNSWGTETTTEIIDAYAGCPRDNQAQGFMLVDYKKKGYVYSDPSIRRSVTVTSPVSAGCLRIVDADDMVLILETTGVSVTHEMTFTFDVPSATFLP